MTREELSERAARILGDKADGSPVGDLTAALDEVERLRVALTTTTDLHAMGFRDNLRAAMLAKALDKNQRLMAALCRWGAWCHSPDGMVGPLFDAAVDGTPAECFPDESATGGEE